MKIPRPLIFGTLAGLALLAAVAPLRSGEPEVVKKTILAMGTTIEIMVPAATRQERSTAASAIAGAFEEIRRIESVLSVYRPDSEVSKINGLKKGERMVLSAGTFDLIARAVELSVMTDGAFDITAKPLVDLWAVARESGRLPSDEAVRNALGRVGSRDIILDSAARTIAFGKEGMSIDFGAVGEGYAIARTIAALKAAGVRNALVNAGGDMYCLGRRSAGARWKVGIRHPRSKDKIIMELSLQDMSINTSGDYEKYFIAGGRRYSHIVDPRTGYAVGGRVISASVIAGDSVAADALATAACVLGSDAMKIFDASGIDAIIVYEENGSMRVAISDGVKGRYGAIEVSNLR